MTQEAVVSICGPHHDPSCPCYHEGTLCFSRPDFAIREALARQAALIFAGDGNEGRDVRRFGVRARDAGVATVCEAVWTREGASNTQRDIRMALELLRRDPTFADVRIFCLVTDPWHMPRARKMAEAELSQAPYVLATAEVNPFWQAPLDMLEREHEGLRAFMSGSYSLSEPHPAGKPVLQSH